MDDRAHAFLKQVLETPSPSGFEQPVQRIVRDWAGTFADEVRTDAHGNVFATRFRDGKPADAPRVMLAGHCDQIGLMVQHVDDNGFLYVQPIGGWDMQILLGQHLTVWTREGPVPGVVARRALRLLRGRPLQAAVYSVSTVQEEIGLRGATTSAYGVHPAVGIAVDVCHATDTPGNEKKQLGDISLGDGPVIFRGPNI